MNLINDENMYYTEKDSDILVDKTLRELLRKCDQIIGVAFFIIGSYAVCFLRLL